MDENISKDKGLNKSLIPERPVSDSNVSYEELLKIKKIYEEMQSIARFGTWEWDIKSGKCILSYGLCNIYGIDKASYQLDYDSFALFRHHEDRETVEKALHAAINERKPYRIGYSIVRTDGEIRHVFEHSSIVYDNNGDPVQVFGSIKDITENLWMEEKLKESEHLYRTLFENTEDAFVIAELIYDAGGSICDFSLVQFNDKFEKQTGVKPENVAGRYAKEMQPGMEHHWIDMCKSIMNANKSMHYQEYSSASKRWYDVFGFPYKQGRLGAIFRDITQYKLAEEALREANENSRLILDSINDGYGMFDRDGTIIKVGKKFADRFGKTPEECEGMKLNDYLPEAKYAELCKRRDELISKVFDTGKLVEFQDTRDGRWYNHRCYPVFKDDKVHAVSIISTDITDSRKAEEEAREIEQLNFEAQVHRKKEQEYLELLDGTFEGTRIIDFKAKRVEFSPKWAQRLGFSRFTPEELFKRANIYIHKDDLDRVLLERREGENNKAGHFAHEYRILAGGSEYIWILDRGKVIYDENGTVSKVYASSIDITESKKAQEKIKRQNAILQAINRVYGKYVLCGSLQELGEACLEIIEEITESKISFVTELGQDGFMHDIAISTTGWDKCSMYDKAGHKRPPGNFTVKGIFGSVLLGGKTLLTNDPAAHPDSMGAPEGHPTLTAFLGVPFFQNGKAAGIVAVANRDGGYSENEKEILEAITPTVYEVLLRKRAEEALRESEEKYRRMIDTAREGIVIDSPEGGYTYVNRQMADLLGYSADEMIGKSGIDFSREEMHPVILRNRAELQKGKFLQGDMRYRRKDGSDLWTIFNITPVFNAKGEHIANFAMHTDITERKRAEEALRESEERYRGVVQNTSAIILRVSPEGIISFANKHALNLFGFTKSELLGKHVIGTIVPERETNGRDLAAMVTELPVNPERFNIHANENMCKSGERVWVEWNNTVIYDSEGRMKESLCVGIDATERKRAEEALRESEEQSRALVRQLEEADRNKNAFLSALSHEIRNPLATISAGLQLMDISDDEAKIKGAKEIIGRQMDQLCSLVDDLLDLTRITNNKIVLKMQRVELNELVSLIVKDHILLANKKGLKLEAQLSRCDVYTDADPVRIKQIIGNLLQNAFKFTKTGGQIVLSVSKENGQATVCVRDSGIGIAPENLTRLFEPFTQIDENIDRQGGGLGLGLSIVKGIAQLHGGDAEAYSEGEGKGACFCIRLPAVKDEKAGGENHIAEEETKRMKVLLIEDNRDYSDMICDLLSCLGYEALGAFDGAEGIAKAKTYAPDVIICDIGLPGMNGYETAKALREDKDMKEVFLIALSGYGGSKFSEAAHDAGFDLHIAKPVDMETLKNILGAIRVK